MAKYLLHLTTHASTSQVFETDLTDRDEIIDAFYETDPNYPDICANCSGWNKWDPPLEIGDDWDVVEVELDD